MIMRETLSGTRLLAHHILPKEDVAEQSMVGRLEEVRGRALGRNVFELRARGTDNTTGLIGTSVAMRRLDAMVRRAAVSDRPVLVTGPTGAGKELTVRAIHRLGPHPDAPLVDLNCGALPESLIESQLFGHERGAFTGAERRHDGFFAAVGEGTLFLDEIGEMPLGVQAKLLRVLESRTFRPLGSNTSKTFSGRIVAATHVDLDTRVDSGHFREDLFYRLNVLEVNVPALDDRREDIGALVAHFAGMQDHPLVFTAAAIHTLQNARWPGNVRQLRNLIDRLAVFAPEGPITPAVIAEVTRQRRPCDAHGAISRLAREILRSDEPEKLRRMEAALIDEALRLADDNKSEAARRLGVHRKAVERRLRARELDRAAVEGCRPAEGLSGLIRRGDAAPAPLADDAPIGA